MSIDKGTVLKVAKLARIKFSEEKAEKMAGDLNNILGMVEELSEVNTDNVAPMTSVVNMQYPSRQDVVTDGGIPEKIIANAPESAAGFFVVPKIVE